MAVNGITVDIGNILYGNGLNGQVNSSPRLIRSLPGIGEQVSQNLLDLVCVGIKPWSVTGSTGSDRNIISKKEYSGVNRLILGMSGYSSPIWGSFKQWQEMGGNVRKGEKGTQVVFYSQITKSEIKPTDLNPDKSTYALLKSYYVFNSDQIEGLEITKPEPVISTFNPVPALDDRILKTGAQISHGGGRAFYRHGTDSIIITR